MFILLEMNGGSTNPYVLLYFGAKYNPAILDGEWWRFFTPMFLHIGFLHLFMNGLSLYYLGTAVESIFGRLRFLIIYLFSGFFGTLASFIFSSHLSAGASGAIFGLFGALLYFGIEHKHTFSGRSGPIFSPWLVWMLLSVLPSLLSIFPGIWVEWLAGFWQQVFSDFRIRKNAIECIIYC